MSVVTAFLEGFVALGAGLVVKNSCHVDFSVKRAVNN
jgi:hypothetical protein